MADSDLIIRAMAASDISDAATLMEHLGYDIASDALVDRFESVDASPDHALILAERDGTILGLLHVFVRPALEKPVEALVQSLVIREDVQCQGIGRRLMNHAEAWARDRGLKSVALHTQVHRDHARLFYGKLGYDEVAEAVLLRKNLET